MNRKEKKIEKSYYEKSETSSTTVFKYCNEVHRENAAGESNEDNETRANKQMVIK